jgi:hypothetical protein
MAHLSVAVSSIQPHLSEAAGHVARHVPSCCRRQAPLKTPALRQRLSEACRRLSAVSHCACSGCRSPHPLRFPRRSPRRQCHPVVAMFIYLISAAPSLLLRRAQRSHGLFPRHRVPPPPKPAVQELNVSWYVGA